MRRIAADYICPISSPPLKKGIIEFDDQGKILSLTDTHGNLNETSRLEYYNGVLVPGLILPCARIEPYIFGTKIKDPGILKSFVNRELETFATNADTDKRFIDLDNKLHRSGIRGAGCISNRFHFFRNKSKGLLNYHSFIEIPDIDESDAYELFNKAVEDIMTAWNEFRLPSSVIPFDCCREEIMEHIIDFATVHENPLVIGCSGNSTRSIIDNFSRILSRVTGKQTDQVMADFRNQVIIITDNLSDVPESLNNNSFLLLPLDNTYTIDPLLASKDRWTRFSGNILFGSHLIEFNPDIPVISEIKSLQTNNPRLSFNDLIKCFTINPSRAMGMDHILGSLIPGTKPGLNLITDFNFGSFKLKETSEIRRII